MRTAETTAATTAPQRQKAPSRAAWLLVAPLFAWVAVFVVAPTLIMLVYSFCERGTLGGVVFRFTLENYLAVFDPTYLQIILRSIVFAALTTAICLAMVKRPFFALETKLQVPAEGSMHAGTVVKLPFVGGAT